MRKLIAKTTIDQRYLHSKKDAFFVYRNAEKILNVLNKEQYKLKEGECWHLYDEDITHEMYVDKKIYLSKNGSIYLKSI